MARLLAEGIEKSFGDKWVLRGCDLRVEAGDKVGLVGVNGSGKSTFLSVLGGAQDPDHGRVEVVGSMAWLRQIPWLEEGTVGDVLTQAVAWHGDLLADYQRALEAGDDDAATRLQDQLDHHGWEVDHKIDAVLQQLRAPSRTTPVAGLSGGEQRRVSLAATLLAGPDMLLLDEPTNHLDADTVEWLQRYLAGYRGGLMLVTHDRYLLEAVADRIVEIEHGKTVSYDGSYADYLLARAERHARQLQADERRRKMLAREAAWAARSPAARSTKQKARLQRLEDLKVKGDVPQDRDFNLDFRTGWKKGGTMLEAHGLAKSFGDRVLFDSVELSLLPGEVVGIIGPNGAGKSTLLRCLLKEETLDAGDVVFGPRIQVGVLDQARTGLNPEHTVFEAAGDGNDHVKIGDHWVHVATFLERFLFRRDDFDQKVTSLSGGERARLLLARLMLRGSNLLVLDEPTNDLDLLTLRVLEEAVLSFDGGVLVVTHDRAFLDRVCTGVLAFEPNGVVTRYASRLQANRAAESRLKAEQAAAKPAPKPTPIAAPKPTPKVKKLSYKEQKELEQLPEDIDALETTIAELEAVLADPDTYKNRADEVPGLNETLASHQTRLESMFDRWEALSERA